MPDFRFRHERLLRVKDLLLRLKSVELREREDGHQRKQTALAVTRHEKQRHLSHSQSSELGGGQLLKPYELQLDTWYTEQLNENLRSQVHQVREADAAVHKQREEVETSAMEKQSLEKLKDHHSQVARVERVRQEQKLLDEVAARQHSNVASRV